MTKEHYMALADFKTLWDNKLKPYIQKTFATKQEAGADYASTTTCEAIVSELV